MSNKNANLITLAVGAVIGSIAALATFVYERILRNRYEYRALPAPEARAPETAPNVDPPVALVPEPIVNSTLNEETPDLIEDCVICLRSMRSSQTIRQLHCNHKFHMLCLKQYLRSNQKTCPICRSNL